MFDLQDRVVSRRFPFCSWIWSFLWNLGFGVWDLRSWPLRSRVASRHLPFLVFGIFTWNLGFGICDSWSRPPRPHSALHRRDRPLRLARGRFPSTVACLARRLFLPNEPQAAPTASLSSLHR